MSGKWGEFGRYGARGQSGPDALAAEMDRMVTGVASPVDTPRGLAARLRALTATQAGYDAMDAAGIRVQPRTLMAWLAEERTPAAAHRARLDSAYWSLRRHQQQGAIYQRLARTGGVPLEIYPVDQRQVEPGRVRDLPVRRIQVHDHQGLWHAAVEAWASGDADELDIVWDEIRADLGSDWDTATHVSHIGIGA